MFREKRENTERVGNFSFPFKTKYTGRNSKYGRISSCQVKGKSRQSQGGCTDYLMCGLIDYLISGCVGMS